MDPSGFAFEHYDDLPDSLRFRLRPWLDARSGYFIPLPDLWDLYVKA